MNDKLKTRDVSIDGFVKPMLSSPNSPVASQGLTIDTSLTLVPTFKVYESMKADIMSRTDRPKYKTGLTELDEILWGIHKKELLTIGARTSQGKSALAIQIMKSLLDTGTRIIYFSTEMSSEQILERLFCNICRVDNTMLRQGRGKGELERNERTFSSWVDSAKLLLDDKYGYNFNNIVEICETVRPDFIVVDYIQMISTQGYKSKVDAIEEFVRKLKELSVLLNFGTILVSQINRSNKDTPNMAGYKWAGVLEEHSDTCLTLQWIVEEGKYMIDVEKQRHGEVGKLRVKFLPQYSLFEDFIEMPRDFHDEK